MKQITTNHSPRRARGFTLVELLVVISIIVILAGIATPAAMRALAHAERVQALANLRSVKGALDVFAADFQGEYPGDNTAIELAELRRDDEPSRRLDRRTLDGGRRLEGGRLNRNQPQRREVAATSNQYFQQLIGPGLDNEKLFYNKAFRRTFQTTRLNNDGQIDRGENVLGYTKNLMSTSSSHLPLVYDTPVSTGDSPQFSKRTWDGRILVARLDGSTVPLMIGGTNEDQGPVRDTIRGRSMNIFTRDALEEGELVPADLKRIGTGN
jgi:prepilin-type N-terminal cleavage/methylation domain-containing protein